MMFCYIKKNMLFVFFEEQYDTFSQKSDLFVKKKKAAVFDTGFFFPKTCIKKRRLSLVELFM